MEEKEWSLMYDYATVTMQNRILSEISNLNSSVSQFLDSIITVLILICFIFLVFIVYKFIIKCLGK